MYTDVLNYSDNDHNVGPRRRRLLLRGALVQQERHVGFLARGAGARRQRPHADPVAVTNREPDAIRHGNRATDAKRFADCVSFSGAVRDATPIPDRQPVSNGDASPDTDEDA